MRLARSSAADYKSKFHPTAFLYPLYLNSFVTPLPVTPAQIAIAIALTVVGATIQGSVGIGYAVIVAPIMMLYAPAFVPGPIVVAALLLVVLMASCERHAVMVCDLPPATFGRIVGTIPAAYALSVMPQSLYELLFGILVMAGVLTSLLGWQFQPTLWNIFMASIASGFMSTVSSMGGPPMALLYQHHDGATIRATISAIFILGGAVTLSGLTWAGRFHSTELLLGLILMPGVVAGFVISRYTTSRIDPDHVRPVLLAASAACALVVIVRSLVAGW